MSTHERLPVGMTIAGHTIETVLGQGGFGITYRVRDNKSGQIAALKEYFPIDDAVRSEGTKVLPKPGNERRFDLGRSAFLDEARTLNALPEQRELVRIKGAFERHGTVCALMDFIDGEPLDKATSLVLSKRDHVPSYLIQDLAGSLLRALKTVHGVHVLHRDIKPANVMIRRDGQPVLIDFGASKNRRRSSSAGSMFSRRYAALEQFPASRSGYRARREEGPEVDLYGLSVLLYELVSQSLPPDAEERFRQYRDSGVDPYLPVRDNILRNRIVATYPDELLNAIDRGCALFPEDRPQSAAEMISMMGRYLNMDETPPEAPPQPGEQTNTRQPTAKSRPARKKKSNGRKWILPALIIVLAAASVSYGVLTQ